MTAGYEIREESTDRADQVRLVLGHGREGKDEFYRIGSLIVEQGGTVYPLERGFGLVYDGPSSAEALGHLYLRASKLARTL